MEARRAADETGSSAHRPEETRQYDSNGSCSGELDSELRPLIETADTGPVGETRARHCTQFIFNQTENHSRRVQWWRWVRGLERAAHRDGAADVCDRYVSTVPRPVSAHGGPRRYRV